jgi:hypothetical protein
MPLDKLQRKIAAIALRAGQRHGLALGGAGALIEHGIIHRPTQDLDLVTNRETGVADAAGPVQAALHDAGLRAVRRGSSLADLFPGFTETLIDLDVTAPDGQQTAVELVYFDRALNTVPVARALTSLNERALSPTSVISRASNLPRITWAMKRAFRSRVCHM